MATIESDGDWVEIAWQFTAINDGNRAGRITDPVFESSNFQNQESKVELTPDDLGTGTITLDYRMLTVVGNIADVIQVDRVVFVS